MKEYLFSVPGNAKSTDVGLLIFRVFAGLALLALHGIGKLPPQPGFVGMVAGMGMPAPELFAWGAAAAEVGGGALLALGLLTRPAGFGLAIYFTIVVLLAHAGDPLVRREPAMFFLFAGLLFMLAGPGRYSVDAAAGGPGRRRIS
jgi:putative oxidoreductase